MIESMFLQRVVQYVSHLANLLESVDLDHIKYIYIYFKFWSGCRSTSVDVKIKQECTLKVDQLHYQTSVGRFVVRVVSLCPCSDLALIHLEWFDHKWSALIGSVHTWLLVVYYKMCLWSDANYCMCFVHKYTVCYQLSNNVCCGRITTYLHIIIITVLWHYHCSKPFETHFCSVTHWFYRVLLLVCCAKQSDVITLTMWLK